MTINNFIRKIKFKLLRINYANKFSKELVKNFYEKLVNINYPFENTLSNWIKNILQTIIRILKYFLNSCKIINLMIKYDKIFLLI